MSNLTGLQPIGQDFNLATLVPLNVNSNHPNIYSNHNQHVPINNNLLPFDPINNITALMNRPENATSIIPIGPLNGGGGSSSSSSSNSGSGNDSGSDNEANRSNTKRNRKGKKIIKKKKPGKKNAIDKRKYRISVGDIKLINKKSKRALKYFLSGCKLENGKNMTMDQLRRKVREVSKKNGYRMEDLQLFVKGKEVLMKRSKKK